MPLTGSIGTWQTGRFTLPDGLLQQTCCAGCGLAFAALSTSVRQPIFAGAGAPTWPREEGWLYMVTMIQARGHSSRYDARYLFLPGRSAAACVLTWKIRRSLCSPNVILCDSLLCRSGPRVLLGVPYDTPEVFFLQGGPLSPTQCRRLHLLKMNSPHICDSERVSPSLPMKGGRPVINAVLAIAIGGDVGGGPPNFQIAFNRIKIERFRCRAVPSSTLCWHLPLRWR